MILTVIGNPKMAKSVTFWPIPGPFYLCVFYKMHLYGRVNEFNIESKQGPEIGQKLVRNWSKWVKWPLFGPLFDHPLAGPTCKMTKKGVRKGGRKITLFWTFYRKSTTKLILKKVKMSKMTTFWTTFWPPAIRGLWFWSVNDV